ncbi:hypothetical protein MPEAHAMD_7027 [Methylobacterium frigidaeris]|uniref:Uncharacterized protein n=1 Tax=Methylobacterium frigidaeris TaxID=2038277 RepID=A0AA37HJ36_9HYPH|nr:hypothetical protein MPEAHAMD_7027 [Methylobacterium frigidaeris]
MRVGGGPVSSTRAASLWQAATEIAVGMCFGPAAKTQRHRPLAKTDRHSPARKLTARTDPHDTKRKGTVRDKDPGGK